MKKYVLPALLAMTFATAASAQQLSARQVEVDAARRVPPTNRVPDSGSTVALLGLSMVLIVLAQRKFAASK
ncbi:MAG TPA: VPDSG-CTERM sorting domain-containing protein [Terrimicrobiaceae bacterium]